MWKKMGSKQTERPSIQDMGGKGGCVFRYQSCMRFFGIWIFKGRLGWTESGVVLVRLRSQLVILNW